MVLSMPATSIASRMDTAIVQTVVGVPATLAGLAGGTFLFLFLADEGSDIVDAAPEPLKKFLIPLRFGVAALWVVIPLLTSSASVYGIGRAAGYNGSFRSTLLGGALPTVTDIGVILWIFGQSGGFEDSPPGNWWRNFLLGSLFLIPAIETIGFHISDRLSRK